MGIQPQNAMTALGYLNSLRALGPSPQQQGTAFDGGYDPQAARRKSFAETWGSAQRGAPNYNKYMDRKNRDNYSPDGAWRGYVNGIGGLEYRAKFGLGGTGPDPKVLEDDARRFAQRNEWNDTMSKHMRNSESFRKGTGGSVGSMLAAHRRMNTAPPGMNPTQTPGIYVPGQKPAPHYETPSDNSIPTPPTTKQTQPGGLGGMPASTPIGSPYYKMDTSGSTPGNEVVKISGSSGPSGNPLMNTMKPRQKPKFGTLGANRGMNGMGLGPNSVAKPGVYGTY